MATLGMDTEAGLAASTELDAGSQKIAELATRLDSAIKSFDWTGTDADRTIDSWQHSEKPTLDTTVSQLATMATLIRQEAQAQDTASGKGATAGGAVGAGATSAQPQGFLGKVGSFITDRISAAYDGLKRTAGYAGGFLGKVADVLTGKEDHSVSEIAASALLTLGAAGGTVANVITGKDQDVLGEGTGVAGTPSVVPGQGHGGQYSPALARPTDLPSLMQSVTDSYQVGKDPSNGGGDVRITRVDNGSGPAYIVSIPGTETWSPVAGSEPRDLSANLGLVAGNPTAANESVRAAMAAAGIPPGAPVLLVGHSQGGIIAGQLASDPAFVRDYNVTNVMTYGAPIDHMQLAPGVQALEVQHRFDVVPRLDLGGVDVNGVNPNTPVTTVTLPSPGGVFGVVTNHDHTEYINSVRAAMAAGDTDAARILRDYQSTLSPFLVTPTGSATAIDVPVTRPALTDTTATEDPVGLLSKMLGGRPGETAINETVRDAIRVLPGVTSQDLRYNHQPNSSGAVSGVVDVVDSATFLEVLRVVRRVLDPLLGAGADRVTFYLTGRTPDGHPVTPGDLGLTQPPTGREIAARLLR